MKEKFSPAKLPSFLDKAMDIHLSSKTFLLSSLLLLIGGLTILGGMYYVLNANLQSNVLQSYLPVTTKPISFNLELTNPEDELLMFDESVVISGKTSPKATIIITNLTSADLDKTSAAEADFQGNFSEVVALTPGLNEFEIAAFDGEGNTKAESRTIYYSEEELE